MIHLLLNRTPTAIVHSLALLVLALIPFVSLPAQQPDSAPAATSREAVNQAARLAGGTEASRPVAVTPGDAREQESGVGGTTGGPASDAVEEGLPGILPGQVDEDAGASRRNENVQFNLIDNNALKEMNVRLGTTATLTEEFTPDKNYFGTEFGGEPVETIHLGPASVQGLHGNVYYNHLNSVLSARSFFQVGSVKPARENNYGFAVSMPAWRGAFFSMDAGQSKIRGQVNGNILVPLPGERTPLTSDPAVAAFVRKILSAYPEELPNRTDIAPRMLNTNSPQSINDDNIGGRIDQKLGDADKLAVHYEFVNQFVSAFQFVKGQNPDTTTKSHSAAATWTRAWSPNTVSDVSVGFDRVHSLLTPDKNFIGFRVSVSRSLELLGPGNTIPIDRAQNDYQWAGLQLVRNRHQLVFGVGAMRRQLNGIESDAAIGMFQFASDTDGSAIEKVAHGQAIGLHPKHREYQPRFSNHVP